MEVQPGKLIGSTEDVKPGQNTYVIGQEIYAAVSGTVQKALSTNVISVSPPGQLQIPKPGDSCVAVAQFIRRNQIEVQIVCVENMLVNQ